MARPEKKDVDYFPFYVKDGRTLFILESKYGCKGTGFFTNVMRFLCQTPEHYYQLKEDTDRLFFFSRAHCDEESGMDMLSIMSKTGKIDADLWVSSAVIVSDDLLKSLTDAYRKRNNKIITIDEIKQKYVSSAGNKISSAGNSHKSCVSGAGNTQRKEKEIKEKKRKYIDSVFLSDTEYKKLQEKIGQKDLDTGIKKLDYSITVKSGKYKDHYKTILNWHERGFLKENDNGTGTKTGGTYRKNYNDPRELPADVAAEADRINEKYAQKAAFANSQNIKKPRPDC